MGRGGQAPSIDSESWMHAPPLTSKASQSLDLGRKGQLFVTLLDLCQVIPNVHLFRLYIYLSEKYFYLSATLCCKM